MPDSLPPDIDDPTIPDEEMLYRRIRPTDPKLQRTPVAGQYRPGSGALKDTENPLSVDLGSLSTPEETRDRYTLSPMHVAGFTAGTARECGCRVVRDPLEETSEHPANPAHALVFGDHRNGTGALVDNRQLKPIARRAQIVLLNPLAPLMVQEEESAGGASV